MKAAIRKIEYYLPSEVETNAALSDENPDWRMADIEEKTGILSRHIARDESVLDMAEAAAHNLLSKNEGLADEIGLLILVTQSPDMPLPTSACVLHGRLSLPKSCMAYDVNLGCSGFVYALATASSAIESGLADKALIVCSDKYSKYISSDDRTCRPLFGDGASATLISRSDEDKVGPFDFGTDGSGYKKLIVEPDESGTLPGGKIHMDGSAVFMFTMSTVPKSVRATLSKAEITEEDVDQFIFHQASKLVIDNLIRRLKLPESKVYVNYPNIGNTVSSTIPIAIKDAFSDGSIKLGDRVLLSGFGVGLSWGACMICVDDLS